MYAAKEGLETEKEDCGGAGLGEIWTSYNAHELVFEAKMQKPLLRQFERFRGEVLDDKVSGVEFESDL
jgi:hypothetical protein